MIIGFDAKRAFFNRTGLGNYSRNLIMSMFQYFPTHQYQLFSPKIKSNHLFPQVEQLKNSTIIHPTGLWPPSLWRSYGINAALQKHHTQIYHGLSAELPLSQKSKRTKYVVTIHDLIFMRFPELYPKLDRNIYIKKTKAACEKADRIIAISEQTKGDLMHFMNIQSERIDVVYQNCDPIFGVELSDHKKQQVSEKYNLPSQFLLSVGTLEKRKNAAIILEALVQLPKEVHVVFVGKPTDYQATLAQFVQSEHLSERVHFLHQVTFEDLPAIYQLANIFIYPSIFEGFGIPIIEALQAQIPVIAATGSCLEEAGGPDSLYFDPQNGSALAQHILSLWDNSNAINIQKEKGLAYSKRFTAQHFASDTMRIYNNTINL